MVLAFPFDGGDVVVIVRGVAIVEGIPVAAHVAEVGAQQERGGAEDEAEDGEEEEGGGHGHGVGWG